MPRWTTCILAATLVTPSGSKATGGGCTDGDSCTPETVLLQKKQHVMMKSSEESVEKQFVVMTSSDESEEDLALDAAAEEEILRDESFMRTYSKLAYETDLREKASSVNLQVNRNEGIEDNIKTTFDNFMTAHPEIRDNFTEEELVRYLARVTNQIVKDMKLASKTPGTVGDSDWSALFGEALEDQKPIVTKAGVENSNREHPDMISKYEGWMSEMSQLEFEKRQGLVPEGFEPPTGLQFRAIRKAQIKERLRLGHTAKQFPTTFDARTEWSHCSDTIMHVRDQGSCGSCWAFAAATAIDGRLCIASGGSFTGSTSYISAGYLTSCTPTSSGDGCSGGDPGAAMRWMGANGAPTGYGQQVGCVPYFVTGGRSTV